MNTTFAKVKILKSNWVEPEFEVQYNLKIAEPIKMRINRAYVTFVTDILEELAPVKKQVIDEYKGILSKNVRQGNGAINMSSGEVFKGSFKANMRHGPGIC